MLGSMKHTPQDGFPYYFELIRDEDLHALFSTLSTFEFLESIDEKTGAHRSSLDKWSIKQIVGHITDHERIKMFRAFQLSRNEGVELWGYDQNSLVQNARFDELTMKQLIEDAFNVRKASSSFIDALSEKQLRTTGTARQYSITLEEFLKSIIGHERHHINIIKRRYLSDI